MSNKELVAKLETTDYKGMWTAEVRKNDVLRGDIKMLTEQNAMLSLAYSQLMEKYEEHKKKKASNWFSRFKPKTIWTFGK